MLPTDKPSYIFKETEDVIQLSDVFGHHDGGTNYHLYFTTDVDIKKGDWVFDSISNKVIQLKNSNPLKFPCKKIIATTDPKLIVFTKLQSDLGDVNMQKAQRLPQPSKAFIEKFCKVGGIDEVEVEYEKFSCPRDVGVCYEKCQGNCLKLKVDSHNTITIHPVKDSWSREEVEELKRLADAVINPASEILPDTYDEELKAYFNWKID